MPLGIAPLHPERMGEDSPRTPDPVPDNCPAWNLPEPLCNWGVSFPLTPTLSLGALVSTQVPSLPTRNEWGESWREGYLNKTRLLSPALSSFLRQEERENRWPRFDKSRSAGISRDGQQDTLSLWERAGVRGKGAIGQRYCVKTSLAPSNNIPIRSGIGQVYLCCAKRNLSAPRA